MRWRVTRLLAVGMGAGLLVAALAVTGGSPSAGGHPSPILLNAPTITEPTVPGPNATLSQWQAWSSQEQAFMQSQVPVWESAPGVINVQLQQLVSNGQTGVPAGIVSDALGLTVNLGAYQAASPPQASQTVGAPDFNSSDCPYMVAGNSGAITDGVACAGVADYGGNSYWDSSYANTSSGTLEGHVEWAIHQPSETAFQAPQ